MLVHSRKSVLRQRIHQALLACGILGPVLFVAVFVAGGELRPGYDAWQQPISALSLGPGGWVQRTSFVVAGLLVAGWGVGLRAVLGAGRGRRWVLPMLLLAGLGLVLDGVFCQDPATGYPAWMVSTGLTWHALVHVSASIVTFSMFACCCLVLGHHFAGRRGWRGWRTYSVFSGGLTVALVVAFFTAEKTAAAPAGVLERSAVAVVAAYAVALCVRLLAIGTTRAPRYAPDLPRRLAPGVRPATAPHSVDGW